jgi:8-oxo-dGTP pyrophosphatase MutT (NUDIX family)
MTMKQRCACGIIIESDKGWLLCHPTNGGNRWDFPKGNAEVGEDHLSAALRELKEETNVELEEDLIKQIVDLGRFSYQDHRDLRLFYLRVDEIDTKSMHCESMVKNLKGPDFPEMDAFAVFPKDKVLEKVSKGMNAWLNRNAKQYLTEVV